jgi:hypothetical protein
MEKLSARAPDPKKHEKYIDFKKNTELLMKGKDYISTSCVSLASLVISYCLTPLI